MNTAPGIFLIFYQKISCFNDTEEEDLCKHCGKGENAGYLNAGYQHFLLLPLFATLSLYSIETHFNESTTDSF